MYLLFIPVRPPIPVLVGKMAKLYKVFPTLMSGGTCLKGEGEGKGELSPLHLVSKALGKSV